MRTTPSEVPKQPRVVYGVLSAAMVLAWAAASFPAAAPEMLCAAELPLRHGEFDALEGWTRLGGHVRRRVESGVTPGT